MSRVFQVILDGICESKTVTVAHSIEDFNNTTVEDFKKTVRCILEGIPDLADLRLVYASDQMEDGRKFSDYKVQHLSHIAVILRMPGGGGTERRDSMDCPEMAMYKPE